MVGVTRSFSSSTACDNALNKEYGAAWERTVPFVRRRRRSKRRRMSDVSGRTKKKKHYKMLTTLGTHWRGSVIGPVSASQVDPRLDYYHVRPRCGSDLGGGREQQRLGGYFDSSSFSCRFVPMSVRHRKPVIEPGLEPSLLRLILACRSRPVMGGPPILAPGSPFPTFSFSFFFSSN